MASVSSFVDGGGRLHIPSGCPLVIRAIMGSLWSADPALRPSSYQVVLFLAQRCDFLQPEYDSVANIAVMSPLDAAAAKMLSRALAQDFLWPDGDRCSLAGAIEAVSYRAEQEEGSAAAQHAMGQRLDGHFDVETIDTTPPGTTRKGLVSEDSVVSSVTVATNHTELDMANVEVRGEIGHGECGRLYGGILTVDLPSGHRTNIDVALKQPNPANVKTKVDARVEDALRYESGLLTWLNSPFVVRGYGCAQHPGGGRTMVAMELGDLGDLRSYVHQHVAYEAAAGYEHATPLPHASMVLLALQLFLGLGHIHDKGLIHRDIAARSVVIASSKGGVATAKISGFGDAREIGEGGSYTLGREVVDGGELLMIPPQHSPPEAFKKRRDVKAKGKLAYLADAAGDMWAAGVTLYEMLTDCSGGDLEGPYLEEGTISSVDGDGMRVTSLPDMASVSSFVDGGGRLHIPSGCPPIFSVIMNALWSADPALRPSSYQVVLFLARRCEVLQPPETRRGEVACSVEGRGVQALTILRQAVAEEPLRQAYANACEYARRESGSKATQNGLDDTLARSYL